METLAQDINQFDATLFGVIDLHKQALSSGAIYWPAMLLAAGAAIAQFFQGRQLIPRSEDARSLRQILKDAGRGKQADQSEVNAAVGRSTLYLLPAFVFIISLSFAAALPLYWLTGSLVAIWQQGRILKEDVDEATATSNKKQKKAKKEDSGVKVTYRTITEKPAAKKPQTKKQQRRRRRK